MARTLLSVVLAFSSLSCGVHEPVPPFRANDARFGRLAGDGDPPSATVMCTRWTSTFAARDENALTHASFPETNAQDACYTPVRHEGRKVRADAPPRGCAYPDAAARARVARLADDLEAQAPHVMKKLFACALTGEQRSAAVAQDVRALRAMSDAEHPYAAVIVPGHGLRAQNQTPLVDWKPGDPCRTLSNADLARLGSMPARAARAADALKGNVAPVAIVSGGAVHSDVVEAFALAHLLECREGIARDRVVVEPCADHTHTNLRNAGRWVHAMRGRAAYLVTDDRLQADYFQEMSGFEFLFGSIDQRSLRDWGYVIGAWRQASVGNAGGFWFTPYRFWAEPRDGLGSVTCVDLP